MTPAKTIFVAAAMLFLLGGCVTRANYRVFPVSGEAVADKLDGTWFERDVYDKDGVSAIELVYCPILPKEPTVCRSSIVWQRNRSALLK